MALRVVFEGQAGQAADGIEEGVGAFGHDLVDVALGVLEEDLFALALDGGGQHVVAVAIFADIGVEDGGGEFEGRGMERDGEVFGERGQLLAAWLRRWERSQRGSSGSLKARVQQSWCRPGNPRGGRGRFRL